MRLSIQRASLYPAHNDWPSLRCRREEAVMDSVEHVADDVLCDNVPASHVLSETVVAESQGG